MSHYDLVTSSGKLLGFSLYPKRWLLQNRWLLYGYDYMSLHINPPFPLKWMSISISAFTVLPTFSTVCFFKCWTLFVCLYVSHAVHTTNIGAGVLFERLLKQSKLCWRKIPPNPTMKYLPSVRGAKTGSFVAMYEIIKTSDDFFLSFPSMNF